MIDERQRMRKTKQCWSDMKQRCYNHRHSQFKNYGARGIVVCERWLDSFDAFFADMGLQPLGMTLDRRDNDGNYEPSNCQWATRLEQRRNQRNVIYLEHDGRRLTLQEWAKLYRMDDETLRRRVQRGMAVRDALTTPPLSINRQKTAHLAASKQQEKP